MKNIVFDKDLLDSVTALAKASPRLRMNYDLRTPASDLPQPSYDQSPAQPSSDQSPVQQTSSQSPAQPSSGNTSPDQSQRMLNALEPGTVLPIHRHRDTTEVVVILRGAARQYFYDDSGRVTETVTIRSGSDCTGFSVAKGRWHRIESLESGTVIFEAKDGVWEPLAEADVLGWPQ